MLHWHYDKGFNYMITLFFHSIVVWNSEQKWQWPVNELFSDFCCQCWVCDVTWFISSHLFLTLVRGLHYSFPCGFVFEWCSPLRCLSALLTSPLLYCCDVSLLLTLHWKTEDKCAVSGARCETLVMSEKCTCLKFMSPTPTSFWSNWSRGTIIIFFSLLVNTNLSSSVLLTLQSVSNGHLEEYEVSNPIYRC